MNEKALKHIKEMRDEQIESYKEYEDNYKKARDAMYHGTDTHQDYRPNPVTRGNRNKGAE